MILGIGVDIVKVGRFKFWLEYSREQLLRVFSPREIENIFSDPRELASQRMASRFAAKEAFYKALSVAMIKLDKTEKTIAFLSACKAITIVPGKWDIPTVEVEWKFFENALGVEIPEFDINLSISHEKEYAVAYVIIQTKN